MSFTSRPTVPITPIALAKLIAAYVHADARVPTLSLGRLSGGTWGKRDLRGIEGSLSLSDSGEMLLSIAGHASVADHDAAILELSDSSQVTTPSPFVTRQGGAIAVGGPAGFSTDILLDDWEWRTGREPVAWVGILRGADFKAYNLLVQSHGAMSAQSLRLQGHFAWHLVRKGVAGERTCVVIVAGDLPSARKRLWPDFAALEFLFGTPLRLDLLIGVNEANEPVAALGANCGYRFRPGASHEEPLPDDRDHAWMAVAFPRIVHALGTDGTSSVGAAACNYVDSTIGHIDGQYLFVQVALEALSNQLCPNEPPLVNDVKAWKAWIDSLSAECETHAVDPMALKVLLGKLRGAYHPTTSRLVEKALKRFALSPPTEAVKEIEGRNIVAHTGSMTGGTGYDVERDVRRIRMIRALLAALTLRSVGYEGALLAWDLDHRRWRLEADWFPVSEAAREESRCVYEIELESPGEGLAP